MTKQQFQGTLAMFRSSCTPKFPKLTAGWVRRFVLIKSLITNLLFYISDEIDGLRVGKFDEKNKDLKCYTACIAQVAGTVTNTTRGVN